jgi:hypothetical protein
VCRSPDHVYVVSAVTRSFGTEPLYINPTVNLTFDGFDIAINPAIIRFDEVAYFPTMAVLFHM